MNSTGSGLSVVISCDCVFHHNWMAFASWYSLNVNLPDAKVIIFSKRGSGGNFFGWAKRCGVDLYFHKQNAGDDKLWQARVVNPALPCLIMDPDVLAVRELTPEMLSLDGNYRDEKDKVWFLKDGIDKPSKTEVLCAPARSDIFSTFVSYGEGWGKFVRGACINRMDYPFRRAERFHGDDMSLNELKILELWKRMDRLFAVVAS